VVQVQRTSRGAVAEASALECDACASSAASLRWYLQQGALYNVKAVLMLGVGGGLVHDEGVAEGEEEHCAAQQQAPHCRICYGFTVVTLGVASPAMLK